MKDGFRKLAVCGEIVGGAAIIVTLIFVGLELRQSNALATTEALKDGTQLWTDAFGTAFGDEETAAFFRKAINHCEELTQDEQARFYAAFAKLIAAYDNIYNQYEAGRLRPEVFISIASGYYGYALMPCVQRVLREEFRLLPPWLISPDGVAPLTGLETQFTPPAFVRD